MKASRRRGTFEIPSDEICLRRIITLLSLVHNTQPRAFVKMITIIIIIILLYFGTFAKSTFRKQFILKQSTAIIINFTFQKTCRF